MNCPLALSFLVLSSVVAHADVAFDKAFLTQHLAPYAGHGFAWENNRIGITDEAPAPWEPVKMEGRVIRLTHRSVELGQRDGAALFTRMTSLSRPVLREGEGLRFTLTDGAGAAHDLTLEPAPVSATNAAVSFRGSKDIPGGKAILECRIEFDGFIHLGLDLLPEPGKEIIVQDLRLTAVLHRAAASHYKYLVPYNFTTEQTEEGRIPSTGELEKDLRLPFSPTLWLGTPEIGLEWMCETSHGWNLKHELNAVLIRPVKDRVIWHNVLINQPTRFPKPAYFACAFYLMPTRPAPHPAWNADTVLVNSDPILDFKAALAPWHTFYGVHRSTSPTPGHPKPAPGRTLTAHLRHFGMNTPHTEGPMARRYRQQRDELREKGIRYLPYTTLHGLPADLPSAEVQVDKAWLEHWDLGTAKKGHAHYFYTVLQHKSLIDFQLHHALRTISQHQLDGQYFDLAQPRAAAGYARRHTADFGKDAFYMPIFGYREFSKRFYIATQQLNPQFLTIHHAVIPTGISSAYTVGSGGEHLKKYFSAEGQGHTHKIAADGTTQLDMDLASYAPDYFKIPPMMYPVGNWFPVFGQTLSFSDILKGTADYYREHPEKLVFYSRTFLARSLVHGVPIWIRSLDMEETLRVFKALDRYGPRTETTKIHAATAPKTHLLNPDTAALEYRIEQKPGHILIIVSNAAKDAQTAEFALSKLVDQPAPWSFVNAESGQPLPATDGKLAISIPTHDFRLIVGTRQP